MRERDPFAAGFTLIELMVTVAVAAVILGLAIPSFAEFIARTRLATATNELVSLINIGRTEAIKRGTRVVVCRSADGTACDGTSWGDGIAVFVDSNRDNAVDAGEPILRSVTTIPDTLTLSATGGLAQRVVFSPAGSALTNGEIALIGGTTDKLKRCVHVAPSGRVEARPYYAGCGSA